jgi:hypothetical protein
MSVEPSLSFCSVVAVELTKDRSHVIILFLCSPSKVKVMKMARAQCIVIPRLDM